MPGVWYLVVSVFVRRLGHYVAKHISLQAKDEAAAEKEGGDLWRVIVAEKRHVVDVGNGVVHTPKLPQLLYTRGL